LNSNVHDLDGQEHLVLIFERAKDPEKSKRPENSETEQNRGVLLSRNLDIVWENGDEVEKREEGRRPVVVHCPRVGVGERTREVFDSEQDDDGRVQAEEGSDVRWIGMEGRKSGQGCQEGTGVGGRVQQ
jgi:hypothetical protein